MMATLSILSTICMFTISICSQYSCPPCHVHKKDKNGMLDSKCSARCRDLSDNRMGNWELESLVHMAHAIWLAWRVLSINTDGTCFRRVQRFERFERFVKAAGHFKAYINPCLDALNNAELGFNIGPITVSTVCCADDTYVLSDRPSGLQSSMNIVSHYAKRYRVFLMPAKQRLLSLGPSKTWSTTMMSATGFWMVAGCHLWQIMNTLAWGAEECWQEYISVQKVYIWLA